MILTGNEIQRQITQGRIDITPFDKNNLQPNSYDLHLDCTKFKRLESIGFDYAKEKYNPEYDDFNCEGYITLEPDTLYLFSTIERTATNHYAPMLQGVSTNARLGLSIHETAGFGDVGFDGKWTLEISCKVPMVLFHGMRIGQIYFHVLEGEIDLYKGKYQNQNGVEGAKSWH